jgi:hypothetical protein
MARSRSTRLLSRPAIAALAVARLAIAGLASTALLATRAPAQSAPRLSNTDRVRLREAYRLADQLGDRIWPRWRDAPFALLLVTPDYEYLVRHSNPTSDFVNLGGDTLLGGPLFYRKRVFPSAMQATFPAVNGVNTIVIGEAELTADKTSTRWVLTVLHEHFHQFVNSQPGYYADVAKLALAHGDSTGMWMLNYPFPYDSVRVQRKFTAMTHALLDALAEGDGPPLGRKVAVFLRAQHEFRASVPPEAEKYFAFQLWQEGVARYTELMVGELASKGYSPSADFGALPDYARYATVAAEVRRKVMNDLGSLSLGKARREVVYSVGGAEALLLDRVRPEWKRNFLARRFRLPDPR